MMTLSTSCAGMTMMHPVNPVDMTTAAINTRNNAGDGLMTGSLLARTSSPAPIMPSNDHPFLFTFLMQVSSFSYHCIRETTSSPRNNVRGIIA
jgi:hypothetical protein